jgi:galactose mutarotase-like enzyme
MPSVSNDVATLRAGALEARFVPSAGMVGASLRVGGRELLGLRSGLDAYRSRGATFGIPLLHPWANRLGGFAYEVDGVGVALDAGSPHVRTEEHGLPIHGLLAAYPGWTVAARTETALSARLDFAADPDLLGAFPFPHELALDVALAPQGLTIATTLTPTGDRAVPVAFGFHPYLALPDVTREDLVLRHGAMTHLALDERGLPTGARAPVAAREAPLGAATYDDLFTDLGPEPAFTLNGAEREVTVRFLEGYTHLQLFAPPGTATVAIEPMTAPTDALRTGDGLRLARRGEPFTATFAIDVRDLAHQDAPGR